MQAMQKNRENLEYVRETAENVWMMIGKHAPKAQRDERKKRKKEREETDRVSQ